MKTRVSPTVTINGVSVSTLDMFKRSNSRQMNGVDRNARFFENYGDVSFEEGYSQYVDWMTGRAALHTKVKEFEAFLIANVSRTNSNVSESRYYNYQGVKYRFSDHMYPAGSMTEYNDGRFTVIDFFTHPELIQDVQF